MEIKMKTVENIHKQKKSRKFKSDINTIGVSLVLVMIFFSTFSFMGQIPRVQSVYINLKRGSDYNQKQKCADKQLNTWWKVENLNLISSIDTTETSLHLNSNLS